MIRFLLLSLLASTLCFASPSREKDYLSRDYGMIAVTYCPEDSGIVTPLAQAMSVAIPRMAGRLGMLPPDSVRFVITPTRDEWLRVTQGAPEWASGIAFARYGVAILKSPRFDRDRGDINLTAAHEAVHLLLEQGSKDADFPVWLNEGLSQFLAGQQVYLDVHMLARAVFAGRLLSLWDIQHLLSMNSGSAHLGYAQSLVAVEYLHERYGDGGLSNLVHELRRGKEIESAFALLFSRTTGQFEREYLGMLKERYSGALWTDGELWISAAFILLVFGAGWAAWRKRKKTLERWRAEQIPESASEPRDVPYSVNYTLGPSRRDQGQAPEDARYDEPKPGN
ncbi:hypothetical protein IT157_00740 [bacterium]|nr:hypothetical protein [bacterium]